MNKMFSKSEDGLSEASWRGKFYGLIKEGRKERVSPMSLKVAAIALAVVICSLQAINMFKPTLKIPIDEKIGIPSVSFNSEQKLNVPLYDFKSASSNAPANTKIKFAPVDRIQRISLSTLKGIPTGSEAKAILSSGATNGTVIAKLSENLIADGDVLLPKDTQLFGKGSSNDERLFIRFRRAILPDKTELKIKAQAFDQNDRMVGLQGKKVSNLAFKLAASSGLIFLSGLADGMKQNQANDIFGNRSPSVHDAALNGIATATSEQGKAMLDSMNREESRVEVKFSTPIVVVFGDDSGQED